MLHMESECALLFPKERCVMLGKWYGPELVGEIGSVLVWSMFIVGLKRVHVFQFLKQGFILLWQVFNWLDH